MHQQHVARFLFPEGRDERAHEWHPNAVQFNGFDGHTPSPSARRRCRACAKA
jgi:hypothetical protein